MKTLHILLLAILCVNCATNRGTTVGERPARPSSTAENMRKTGNAVTVAESVLAAMGGKAGSVVKETGNTKSLGTIKTSVPLADGSVNWGNQNNTSYGNCLDILSPAALSLRDAERQSHRVDVIFVAANSSYQLWAPQYVLSDPAPEYTSKSVYNSVPRWSTVHDSQIAEVKMSGDKFSKIQTPAQIKAAVNGASNFMSWLTLFDNLEGRTFAVRTRADNRTAYALIKVKKHYGTSGSSGYLNVQIKSAR